MTASSHERKREYLVGGDGYLGKVFDAIVLDAHFDATDRKDLADWLVQLSAFVRTGAMHDYKKDLTAAVVDDELWRPADWQTARKGAVVREASTRRMGRVVGVRASNAVYVRWDDTGGVGMGDSRPMSALEVRV